MDAIGTVCCMLDALMLCKASILLTLPVKTILGCGFPIRYWEHTAKARESLKRHEKGLTTGIGLWKT